MYVYNFFFIAMQSEVSTAAKAGRQGRPIKPRSRHWTQLPICLARACKWRQSVARPLPLSVRQKRRDGTGRDGTGRDVRIIFVCLSVCPPLSLRHKRRFGTGRDVRIISVCLSVSLSLCLTVPRSLYDRNDGTGR